jgi:hypothetical protein
MGRWRRCWRIAASARALATRPRRRPAANPQRERRPARIRQYALAGGLVLTACLGGLAPVLPARAATDGVPAGYDIVARERLGTGVEHLRLRRGLPAVDVHVARLAAGTGGRLLPVLAGEALTGPSSGLATTSEMCVRVSCVAAVNGDFFDTATGRPIGAMVAGGELIATPAAGHVLLRIDGQGQPTLRPGLDWAVRVTTSDGQAVAVQAVNRPSAPDGVTLYTRRWGTTTGADPAAVELALELVAPASPVLPSGSTAARVIGPLAAGGQAGIGPGQVVLSGKGAGAQVLAALAQRATSTAGAVLVDVDLGGTVSAIGGSPQLLENDMPAYPVANIDDFTVGRHARTMVGITAQGEILLVTADRSATSTGLALLDAADLMGGLGAVHAVNLDGGGSTTYVTGGVVRNRPDSPKERRVASALAVVPADPVTALVDQVLSTVTGLLAPRPALTPTRAGAPSR